MPKGIKFCYRMPTRGQLNAGKSTVTPSNVAPDRRIQSYFPFDLSGETMLEKRSFRSWLVNLNIAHSVSKLMRARRYTPDSERHFRGYGQFTSCVRSDHRR